MFKADEILIALAVVSDEELYLAGIAADIQRLHDAGFVERVWAIGLDNGHRPYGVLKKRLAYDINQPPCGEETNILTKQISNQTRLTFTKNLHAVDHLYVLRKSPAFWTEIAVAFADEDGRLRDIIPTDYYAIFRGGLTTSGNIRFIRLEPDTLV